MPGGISPVSSGRRDALPPGTVLRDYTLVSVLGHGGFGIVYLARHNQLAHRVAIKEYLPLELAVREGKVIHPRSPNFAEYLEDGRRRFQEEAQALINFRHHPSIVTCLEYFQANETAYLVMEHEDGLPLSKVLQTRESAGNPFDEADLLAIAMPLLEALQKVHQAGVVHRDIKPANIFVRRRDHTPVLIDFGAAKQEVAAHSKSMAPYTPGYAAFEQVGEGALGPWTDIYAVGAVLWRMVAGGQPPEQGLNPVRVERRMAAKMRQQDDPLPSASQLGAGRFSMGVLRAIDQCLELLDDERVRDCNALLGLLLGKAESRNDGFPSREEQSSQSALGNAGESDSVRQIRRAAKRGQAAAQFYLGQLYSSREGEAKVKAIDWYRRAANQGHVDAPYWLGRMYLDGEPSLRDCSEAARWLRKGADQGHAPAQYALGWCYARGTGVRQDDKVALRWFRQAAGQGNEDAQFALGLCYALGDFDPADDEETFLWYRDAAEDGLASHKHSLHPCWMWGNLNNLGSMDELDQVACLPVDSPYVEYDAEAEAVQWFRQAATQGHAAAQFALGWQYANGRGVPKDAGESIRWFRQAATQGHAPAQFVLGRHYTHGEDVPEDAVEAVRWFRQAADRGYAPAEFALGWQYAQGKGVPEDATEAVRWFRKGADQGHVPAQYALGGCYARGTGVRRDDKVALRWFRQAAGQGHAAAQFALGLCHSICHSFHDYAPADDEETVLWYREAEEDGLASPKHSLHPWGMWDDPDSMAELHDVAALQCSDDEEPVQWFRQAATQGHAAAQFALGWHYAHGEGVPEDAGEAIQWFHRAADQGHAPAQFVLGRHYTHVEGVREDAVEAVRWFRQAADRGYAPAEFALGWHYAHGKGVPEDATEAVRWFQKAAAVYGTPSDGHVGAQYNLGSMCFHSEGVSSREADYWLDMAVQQGYAPAQFALGMRYDEAGFNIDAVEWYRKAAEQEHAAAQFALCVYFVEDPWIVDKLDVSNMCYQASIQGYAPAEIAFSVCFANDEEGMRLGAQDVQLALSVCFANGEGVLGDEEQTLEWCRRAGEQNSRLLGRRLSEAYQVEWCRAVEQDYAPAQFALSVCFANGEGVPRNEEQALEWCRQAAEQGYAIAQFALGNRYANGQGVPADDQQAAQWFRKAADQGHDLARVALGDRYDGDIGKPQVRSGSPPVVSQVH